MRRYYFHVRSNDGYLLRDHEGDALAGPYDAIDCARESALQIRDMLTGTWRHAAFEIEDEDGALVATLSLLTGRRRRGLPSSVAQRYAEAA